MSSPLRLLIPLGTIMLATCGCGSHGSPATTHTNRPSSSARPLTDNPSSSAYPLTSNPSNSAYPLTGDPSAIGLRPVSADRTRLSVQGGSATQRRLLEQILGRVDSRLFRRVELTSPPAGFGQFPQTDGTWVDFTTAAGGASGDGPGSVIASWEAMLAAGAHRDLSAKNLSPRTSASQHTSSAQTASPPATDTGGDAVLGPVPASEPTDYTQQQITQTVESNIGKLGLRLDSIHFVQPNHLVPIVVATTDDPAGFVNRDASLESLFGDVSRYEGIGVENHDASGAPVEVVGVSTRIDQATRWIRSDLAAPTAGDAYPNPGGG